MKRIFTMLPTLGMMVVAVGCSASQKEQQNQNNSSVQEETFCLRCFYLI